MNLTTEHFIALLPLLITAGTLMAAMLGIAWKRCHRMTFLITVVGLNLALLSLYPVLKVAPLEVTPLMTVDRLAVMMMALVLVAGLAVATLARAYLGHQEGEGYPANREEMYLLVLLSVAGALVLVSTRHLAGMFIGLELMSMPLYGMIGYAFFQRRSLEAALKYLVLSGAGSAALLFGTALLYAEAGSLAFSDLALLDGGSHFAQLALGLMVVGFAFKLSLAPFHLWTPDVYEGAPAPVATFLATVGKVAVFTVMLRLFMELPVVNEGWLKPMLMVLAGLSILVGNLLALQQSNIKRLLGYSSVAHFGYLLLVVFPGNVESVEAAVVYMATYLFTSVAVFGVVTLMSSPFGGRDSDALYEYRGLFWRRPWLTAVMTVGMLSLAGIPLTAGFIGKFYLIAVGVGAQLWWLIGLLIVGSAIGLYYYLRVMTTMFLLEGRMIRRQPPLNWEQQAGGIMLLLAAALVIVLGVYPQPLLVLAQAASL